jgi:hypothetical protein
MYQDNILKIWNNVMDTIFHFCVQSEPQEHSNPIVVRIFVFSKNRSTICRDQTRIIRLRQLPGPGPGEGKGIIAGQSQQAHAAHRKIEPVQARKGKHRGCDHRSQRIAGKSA